MTSAEAIKKANDVLPGKAAPEKHTDPRWQAIIAVGKFIEADPMPVLEFAEHWGQHPDPDLRAAIATCLVEHLLEHHFSLVFPRVKSLARANQLFGNTVSLCFKFGGTLEPQNSASFDQLVNEVGDAS